MECGHQVLQLLLEGKGVSWARGVWVGVAQCALLQIYF